MNYKPFIVAEMGASHNGSFERAIKIIDAAKEVGADAVKLQTYTPDILVSDRSYVIQEGPWVGQRLWDLYDRAKTPWEWHEPLFQHAKNIGLVCFSTAYDRTAVDFLETLDCPIYKVASFEIIDIDLIRYIAKTGKPMIISTGMATQYEVRRAWYNAGEAGCRDITLLKCTSSYPAPLEEINLATMRHMRETFNCKVGFSDHTPGIEAAIVATILGADVIEKHLTLDDEPGPDSHFSLRPDRFKDLVETVRNAAEVRPAIGKVHYGPTPSEHSSLAIRRIRNACKSPQAAAITNIS